MIRAAASGCQVDRATFVERYRQSVAAFFASRWRRSHLVGQVEDATQEVFLECLRPGGVLERADPDRPNGFRALFFGVLRNVAGRHEARAGRQLRRAEGVPPDSLPSTDASPSRISDRTWARALLAEAVRRMAERATGDDSVKKRFELLRLRFEEGLPIRAIAQHWHVDPTWVHHQYATGRSEFERVLREVIAERAPQGERKQLLHRLLESL